MKKNIFFFIIICFSQSLYAQKEIAVFCEGKGYKGHVFDTSYFILKSIKNQQAKVNLSCEEIKEVEAILKEELSKLNTNKLNQSSGCPNIEKRLSKYCRQYFGFINTKGEVIIWINMFWNKDLNDKAKDHLIDVSDGCSRYWNIEVNIKTKELSNLQINGKG